MCNTVITVGMLNEYNATSKHYTIMTDESALDLVPCRTVVQ